jgi:hypothetical protein
MSVVAAEARPTRKTFPKTKGTLVVAVALLALIAFAAFMIPASEAKNAEHSYSAARSTPDRSGQRRRFPPSLKRRRLST